jgi:epoxyqueuosine reductase QueG
VSLNEIIKEFLLEKGAIKVGFANKKTLAGGPPSIDLDYRLEGAKSAISFALPMNRDHIRLFLAKKDRSPHENDNIATNLKCRDLSWELATMLKSEGHLSKGCAANQKYRQEVENWQLHLHPDLSHRYMAARSGVGSFGWSGNVGIKDFGTAIMLGTAVTVAELEPTDPETREEQFCDQCKMCVSACATDMFDREKEESVTLGGKEFKYAFRNEILRCNLCCGGITGLSTSGKWSTWSPGRYELPLEQEKLIGVAMNASQGYMKRPPIPGGYVNVVNNARTYMTCGNCQIACWGNKNDTAENVKILHNSGCVIQNPDGEIRVYPAEEAAEKFEQLPVDHRAHYCQLN